MNIWYKSGVIFHHIPRKVTLRPMWSCHHLAHGVYDLLTSRNAACDTFVWILLIAITPPSCCCCLARNIYIKNEPDVSTPESQHEGGNLSHMFITISRESFNSSPLSAAYMRQLIGSALIQVMACRLFGAKPLHEPMLAYCQLDSWENSSLKFKWEFWHFHSIKCIWNCRLPKWWPFYTRDFQSQDQWPNFDVTMVKKWKL